MTTDGEDSADVDASAAAAAGTPGRDDPPAPRARPDAADSDSDPDAPADPSSEPVDPRDARVNDDPFGPPRIPCQCYCLHCRRTFMSSEIWFQRITNAQPGKLDGFWMCPTPNCDGKGFTFDIFPTDPDHPSNAGWTYTDDDEDDDYDDAAADDEEWDEAFDPAAASASPVESEYDPDETKWKQLDAELGEDADDDIEGEEWKYGLQPGEALPEPEWLSAGRRDREEEERRYDEPDERPREIEWEYRDEINEDDIPF